MAGDRFRMDDYRDVAVRIEEFYEKFPEGRLTSEIVNFEVEGRGKTASNQEVLIGWCLMKGYAYRTPDDPRPGTGHSYLLMPGGTPYTRGSEIENAETSAWGRAIVAVGIKTKKIASADEISSKQYEEGYEGVTEVRITPSNREQPARGGHQKYASRPQIIEIIGLAKELNFTTEELMLTAAGISGVDLIELDEDEEAAKAQVKQFLAALTAEQAAQVIADLQQANEQALPEVPTTEPIELKLDEPIKITP